LPFFLGAWLDLKIPVMTLMLPKWVAPNPPTQPALKPEFDWVVGAAQVGGTKLANRTSTEA
jgi:hypothetical protein